MKWLERLAAVAAKEVRQLARDRITIGLIVGIPAIQLLLYGYAINFDVRGVQTVVLDQARSSLSRRLVGDLGVTQVLGGIRQARTDAELHELMRQGDANIAIVIPADVERRIAQGDRAALQILVDGSQPVLENVAAGLASLPFLRRPGRPAAARPVEIMVAYNPERRTAVQIVPALCGVILTMTMMVFTSTAIVRERERGNLELLITTPVSTAELMAGKLLPYVGIGLIQTTLILALGYWLFGVAIQGSLIELYLGALLFIAASLSMGLLISTVAQTQFQAIQMSLVMVLPSILMSGFMFPFEGMPKAAQWIAQVLPLTHFNEIIRGIVLRGASLADMRFELGKLSVILILMLTFAMARFRKRLD
ncbi:MAG: ABC transporter permease [Gammaproteobacteria bacterium]|nr:ABC transporter permease [Gammaproteobacteria bacterium]